MDANTEMFIGFLILEWMIFFPLITIGVAGYIITKFKIKQIDRKWEELDNGK